MLFQLHDMTASYSEISFDSITSPQSIFGGSPGSSDLELLGKIKTESEFKYAENTEYDNKRPDKLEIQRYVEKISRNSDSSQSFHKSIKDLRLEGTVTTDGDMVLFVAEDLENKIKLSSPVTKKGGKFYFSF